MTNSKAQPTDIEIFEARWTQVITNAEDILELEDPTTSHEAALAAKRALDKMTGASRAMRPYLIEQLEKTKNPNVLQLAKKALAEFKAGRQQEAFHLRNRAVTPIRYRKSKAAQEVIAELDYLCGETLIKQAMANEDPASVRSLLLDAPAFNKKLEEHADFKKMQELLPIEEATRAKVTEAFVATREGRLVEATEMLMKVAAILSDHAEPIFTHVADDHSRAINNLVGELDAFARTALESRNLAVARKYHDMMLAVARDDELTLALGADITRASA
jgi:hypothetical protein